MEKGVSIAPSLSYLIYMDMEGAKKPDSTVSVACACS